MQEIEKLRAKIDKIDDEIALLLEKRMENVRKIAKIKDLNSLSTYIPQRENSILQRLKKLDLKNISDLAIKSIFSEIFSVSRNLTNTQNIAFCGANSSQIHQASLLKFGKMSNYLPKQDSKSVFEIIAKNGAMYGVISDNDINYKDFKEFKNIKIICEILMQEEYVFVTNCEKTTKIQKIYIHPGIYEKGLKFINNFGLQGVEIILINSYEMAAKLACKDLSSGAICTKIAGNNYEFLSSFELDIEPKKSKFFVLGESLNISSSGKNSKSTIFIRFDKNSFVLSRILEILQDYEIEILDMKVISKEKNKEIYIDLNIHNEDNEFKKALKNIKKQDCEVLWLGSYASTQ